MDSRVLGKRLQDDRSLLSLCLVLRVEDQPRESELEFRVCILGLMRVANVVLRAFCVKSFSR